MHSPIPSMCVRYLSRCKWFFLGAILSGAIYGAMSGLGLPLISGKVFQRIFEEPENYSWLTVFGIALLIPLCFSIRGVFGYLSTIWMNRCGLRILTDLRSDLYRKLQVLPLAFFEEKTTGDLLHRIIADPQNLQNLLLETSTEFIKQPLQMLAAFGSLIYLSIQHCDWVLFSIFLIAFPICFLPVKILRPRTKQASRACQYAEGAVTTRVSENLLAAQEIRLFNMEEASSKTIEAAMLKANQANYVTIRLQKLQQPIMEIVSACIVAIVFTYAYCRHIPFSVFSAMGLALYFAFDPIKRLNNLMGNIQRVTGSLERITEILQCVPSIQSPTQNAYHGACDGSFVLKDVGFHYPNAPQSALESLNLSIPFGRFYALVGTSGSGKSTLIKLLARLYDVTSGSITLSNVDLRQWDLAHLRQQIAIVSQATMLFNDTFLANLRFGKPDATRKEVIQAAQMAYAHDFIVAAGGYDATIGENGNRFSGGQRQRLAIARAFLKQAPILILDEATSALDSESEHFIKQSIEAIRINKTVIAIAHRISTIQRADYILLLDHGHLVGEGTHTELLKTNAYYQRLVEKQLIAGEETPHGSQQPNSTP